MAPRLQRIIHSCRELGPDEGLDALAEAHVRKLFLCPLDESACREWQRSGRCNDKGCRFAGSHTMENSPRYVQHLHSASSSSESTPQASPEPSPAPSPRLSSTGLITPIPKLKKGVCRNWAAHGECRYGEQCHFAVSHTPENFCSQCTQSSLLVPETVPVGSQRASLTQSPFHTTPESMPVAGMPPHLLQEKRGSWTGTYSEAHEYVRRNSWRDSTPRAPPPPGFEMEPKADLGPQAPVMQYAAPLNWAGANMYNSMPVASPPVYYNYVQQVTQWA